MLDEAYRAGVTLMVAENARFLGPVQRSKQLIDQGAIGAVRLIQLQAETPFRPSQWRNNRALNGGGVLIDSGIHKVDMLLYLTGKPTHLYAVPLPQELGHSGVEDGLVVTTRSATGVVGLIHHAWTSAQQPGPAWVAVSGTRGRLYFEPGAPWLQVDDGTSERTIQLPEDHYGLVPMVREFHDSIVAGREPQMSGADGLTDLEVVLKAYESIERGISLPLT